MLCEAEATANSDVLRLLWPKTPLFTVFLNLLSKNTAICDVFNDMVAKLARFFTFSHKDVKPRQCTKTLQKPMFLMFLPNKNGENRHPNSSEIIKSGRQDMKKARLKTENRRPTVKKLLLFTFRLPVPGGRMHELLHSVL